MKKAPNFEERILGVRAVEKRFLTERQLIECLNTIDFFEPNKTLEQVLLDKGYLTKAQIERLKSQIDEEAASFGSEKKEAGPSKKKFGEIALEQNMINEDQLTESLDEQDTYITRGLRVQIGQILFKKQYLTMTQVNNVLKSQLKKTLYCKKCKTSKVVHSYDAGSLYQCDGCGLDMVETKVKAAPKKKAEEDLGTLDILEL